MKSIDGYIYLISRWAIKTFVNVLWVVIVQMLLHLIVFQRIMEGFLIGS